MTRNWRDDPEISPSSTNSEATRNKEKGLYELLIFCAAIATGTTCSIVSKIIYDMQGIGHDGAIHNFNKPLLQTLGMFVAMIFGMPMHWAVIHYNISFPGYGRFNNENNISTKDELTYLFSPRDEEEAEEDETDSSTTIPAKTYLYLAIPAAFDLIATALCMIGLLYLDVSIYQLLRGSGIIFVAILRQWALKERLYYFQWIGVGYNVLSVLLASMVALLHSSSPSSTSDTEQAVAGVFFMLAGTLVQAMQFVFEEKVMVQDAVKVPPLLLFGMEGVWGLIFCLFILYPVGFYLPGEDNGHLEDYSNTWFMLLNNPRILGALFLYLLAIFGYNLFAVLVTFSLSSIWHSILDNYRPLSVWATDLLIYYISGRNGFGEAWTRYSWIQLAGMMVLIYGTAIYNAPDAGSIRLEGTCYSLGLNCHEEYTEILAQRMFSMGSYPSLHRFQARAQSTRSVSASRTADSKYRTFSAEHSM